MPSKTRVKARHRNDEVFRKAEAVLHSCQRSEKPNSTNSGVIVTWTSDGKHVATGRYITQGTASVVGTDDYPWINFSGKRAKRLRLFGS